MNMKLYGCKERIKIIYPRLNNTESAASSARSAGWMKRFREGGCPGIGQRGSMAVISELPICSSRQRINVIRTKMRIRWGVARKIA